MTIKVYAPALDELARAWPTIEPILKRATDRTGSYEPVDILSLAVVGKMTVWLVQFDDELVAVAVTEVRQFPRNRVMEVTFLAGRHMRSWVEQLFGELEAHARRAGCFSVQSGGRRGWKRVSGDPEIGVIVERRL